MVWLYLSYLSLIPVVRGGFLFVQMTSTCLRGAKRNGEGGQHPVNYPEMEFMNRILIKDSCSLLHATPATSTGGFKRKPDSSLIFLTKKTTKQENSSLHE
jgi:hypothetical protein